MGPCRGDVDDTTWNDNQNSPVHGRPALRNESDATTLAKNSNCRTSTGFCTVRNMWNCVQEFGPRSSAGQDHLDLSFLTTDVPVP